MDRKHRIYFDEDILRFSEDECFVDGGVFNEYTTQEFIARVGGCYRAALLFEPDADRLGPLCERFASERRVRVIDRGLFDRACEIGFGGPPASARIDDSLPDKIRTVRLDDYYNDNITFVKFDIEGAEIPALRGAERILRERKPKLAICVYHKPTDLWEIPLLIRAFQPEYRLYLRHYLNIDTDTVCYAVPR